MRRYSSGIRGSIINTLALLALGAGLLLSGAGGCTAVQRVSDTPSDRAFLRLDVQPTSTRIFIDTEYQGVVDGWAQQTVPVTPGDRMVELRADGFITRRFDVRVEAGQQVTLQVRMERELDDVEPISD